MNWQEVCEHPSLQDLPFKIELNEKGTVLMSPVKVYHSAYQGRIAILLYQHIQEHGGEVLSECAIATSKGTKVADVAWVSDERFEQIKEETECSIAPEICIEVLSSSNTGDEMAQKRSLYFNQGAKEVWICTQIGTMSFYNAQGKQAKSSLVPQFPERI